MHTLFTTNAVILWIIWVIQPLPPPRQPQKVVPPAIEFPHFSGWSGISDPGEKALPEDCHRCLLQHFHIGGYGTLELVELVISDNRLWSHFRKLSPCKKSSSAYAWALQKAVKNTHILKVKSVLSWESQSVTWYDLQLRAQARRCLLRLEKTGYVSLLLLFGK